MPLKILFFNVWFFIPKRIKRYNMAKCENYYPDYDNMRGTKVRPFLSYVFLPDEGELMRINWWKNIKRKK